MQPAPTSHTDPVLETQVFWTRYKTPILIALAVVVCGAAGYGAFRLYAAKRDAAAASLLAEAKSAPDYEKVIAQYPSSGAATSSALLLAAEQREKKQYAEANVTLEKFVNAQPGNEFVSTAKMAMAANLDSMGKTDQALQMYQQIAANYGQSYTAPLALIAQAQLLKGQGKIEEARQICETVMTQHRDSYATLEATQMLKSLKPAATPAPVATVVPVPLASPAPTLAATATALESPVAQSPAASAKPKKKK